MILLSGTGFLCERLAGRTEISVHPVRDQRPGRRCLVAGSRDEPGPAPSATEPATAIEEINVLGRRGLGTDFHDSPQIGSSLTTWDEKAIRTSGAFVVSDLLESTSNFPGGPSQDTHYASTEAAQNSGLTTAADIRGLGARSTLVLMDGHPMAPSGYADSFYDLLQFPLGAISRVEMLPDGASGIYGTQAVGGAIEIDTRDHFSQAESHLETGGVTDGHQDKYRLSQSLGKDWEGGSVLVVAELLQWDALPASERGQANTAHVAFTVPGNLITSLGTFPIVPGSPGQPLNFLTLSSGPAHLTDPQLEASILPSQRRWALYGSFDQALSSSITLLSHVLWTERDAQESLGAQEVYLDVTHSPYLSNPPAGLVYEEYSLLSDFGPQIASVDVRTLNAAVELHIQLSCGWYLVLSGSDSLETEVQLGLGQVNTTDLQASVSNATTGTAFNPLGGGSDTAAGVLDGLNRPEWFDSRSEVRSYQAIADGPLFPLWWADTVKGAFGIEVRDQRFDWSVSDPAAANDLRRLLYAGFSEIKVPLWDEKRFASPWRNLTLSFAGRTESYSDFGSSATPRIGASWAPFRWIELRGAWARSVRAPDLGDLSQKNNSSFAEMLNGTSSLVWSGGAPNLGVERALTRTVGMALDSGTALAVHLKFDLGYFDILSRDRIEQEPLTENALSDPLYASFVFKNPDSSLKQYVCNNTTFVGGTRQSCLQQVFGAIVDLRMRNAGTLWTDGIDARMGMSVESSAGIWALDLAGTYVLHYREATLTGAALESTLDTESHPLALHLVGTGSWKRAGFHANLTVRYENGYYNNETQPVSRVGSWTTTDARVAYTFENADRPGSPSTELALYVGNLFDRYPPYSNDVVGSTGYDQENADLSGRTVSLSVHVKY